MKENCAYNYKVFYPILNKALSQVDALIRSLQDTRHSLVIAITALDAYHQAEKLTED
jgi:hypothetical protein